jgi:hypothetical protein
MEEVMDRSGNHIPHTQEGLFVMSASQPQKLEARIPSGCMVADETRIEVQKSMLHPRIP